MRRLTFTSLPIPLLCCALLCSVPAAAHPQIDTTYGPLPVFELHSGFWINLHHTLYQEARLRAGASDRASSPKSTGPAIKTAPGAKSAFSSAERRAWDDAVNYYAANYAGKDLLFSTELMLLKNQLEDFEECPELSGAKNKLCDAGLPSNLTHVLEAAAPAYRAHQWPGHDRANRAWIIRVAPLVREQGVGLSHRLADIYQTRWPLQKIRVDVTAYANSGGAYTTLDPLRVTISSTDPRNQGDAALEVLFHEASHGIAQPVEQAIIRECRQRNKPIPRDLWHALLFYTTGEVIKPILSSQESDKESDDSVPDGTGKNRNNKDSSINPDNRKNEGDYTPYAVREGLYARGWSNYLALLTRFWQPYLDGQATFDDAIARIVSSL